jgi:hypothetical protein
MWSSAVPGLQPSHLMQLPAPQLYHGRAIVSSGNRSRRLFSTIIALISLVSIVSSQRLELEAGAYDTAVFRRLESKGEIFFDRRDPPPLPRAVIQRRQDNGGSSNTTSTFTASSTSLGSSSATSSSTTTPTSSVSNSSSSSSHSPTSGISQTPTATRTIPSSTTAPTALPSPFDSSLGSNFTSQACPDFFNSFLSNTTFQSCVPVSLLLQNSKSFFSAARSPVVLEETLNVACAASLPICQPLMESLASDLISNSNCGEDYQNENPLVAQAHAGLVAYEAVYQATCLKSNETANYCFADAITNQLNPSDAYPYYAAVGLNLPPASHPTCSKCLQDTMTIFAGYAKDGNQPLAATYINTAKEIDVDCGANFANTAVPVGTMSSSTNGGARCYINSLAAPAVAVAVALSLRW